MERDNNTLSLQLQRLILERDKFTCTECGKQVPKVFLYVAKILSPDSEQSLGDIPEEDKYTCLCESCYRKSKRKLQNRGIVTASQRREQLDLLVSWHREEQTLEEAAHEITINYLRQQIKPAHLYKAEKTRLKDLLKNYDIIDILNAIDTSVTKYARFDGDNCIQESVTEVVAKLGGILYNQNLGPIDGEINHIRHICRRNFPDDYEDRKAKVLLHDYESYLRSQDMSEDEILAELAEKPKRFAGSCGTFSQWCDAMHKEIRQDKEDSTSISSVINSVGKRGNVYLSSMGRKNVDDYDLYMSLDYDMDRANLCVRTLMYLYQRTGYYSEERWKNTLDELTSAFYKFIEDQLDDFEQNPGIPATYSFEDQIPFYTESMSLSRVMIDGAEDVMLTDMPEKVVKYYLNDFLDTLIATIFKPFYMPESTMDHNSCVRALMYVLPRYLKIFEVDEPTRVYSSLEPFRR